ncbi:hypothetical protein AB0F72_17240 [Actinoplanes sp. NPDC023936]|uniref:hypothetical protein n=1 Tax=Actinoplanes sp. NPDC023936 TaxID=3154910 RepID=UPI0033FD4210
MTARAAFQDGDRLRVDDLNQEAASRAADADTHRAVVHPVRGADRGLLGASISSAAEGTSISLVPAGPSSSVRVDLPDVPDALRLAPGGHRAAGPVQGSGTSLTVHGAVRMTAAAVPPPEPAPWTIRALDHRDDQNRLIGRELRIELEVPAGSSPANSRVAVRVRAEADLTEPPPDPRFLVDATGTVTVSGDLTVAGTVSQGLVPADPADPRFVAALVDVLAQRIAGLATQPENAAIKLTVTADPSGSTANSTKLVVGSTVDRVFPHWGVALEIHRESVKSFRLVQIGGHPFAMNPIEATARAEWATPLTPETAATVFVAVVAFDLQGQLFAQRVPITVPPPPAAEGDGDIDEGLEFPV